MTPTRPISRASRRPRSRKPAFPRNSLYLLGALLLLIAAVASVPALRRGREHLLILRNLTEEAAAPDEPVLAGSLWLDRFLRWKGSPALRQDLLYAQGGQVPGELLAPPRELIVVATEHDALLTSLRSYGYILTPDATQDHWNATGHATVLPFAGVVHIYFAAPPRTTQGPSNPQGGTP